LPTLLLRGLLVLLLVSLLLRPVPQGMQQQAQQAQAQ
jgi:hypothetical protein